MLKSIVAESYHNSPVEKKNSISNVPIKKVKNRERYLNVKSLLLFELTHFGFEAHLKAFKGHIPLTKGLGIHFKWF